LLRVNLRKGKRFAPFFFVAAKAATHNARPNFYARRWCNLEARKTE
jgi:hypothetical protein